MAEFITQNGRDSAFLGLREIANETGTSTATVHRLAKSLGFAGFREMQREFIKALKSEFGPSARFESTIEHSLEVHDGPVALQPLKAAMQRDVRLLEETLRLADPDGFVRAADLLAKAGTVYVLGQGLGLAPVAVLAHRLPRYGIPVVQLAGQVNALFNALLPIRSDDVLFISSFRTPVPASVSQAVEFVASRGSAVVALTDTPLSSLPKSATVTLYAKRSEEHEMASMAAPVSMINGLAMAIGVRRHDVAAELYASYEALVAGASKEIDDHA